MIKPSLSESLLQTYRNGYGLKISKSERVYFKARLQSKVPSWYVNALCDYPLCRSAWGYPFKDEIRMIRWATYQEMLFESYDVSPGTDIYHLGYFAVAVSIDRYDTHIEDPYFLDFSMNCSDPRVVRVYRDQLVVDSQKIIRGVELIAETLSEFFVKARSLPCNPQDRRALRNRINPASYRVLGMIE